MIESKFARMRAIETEMVMNLSKRLQPLNLVVDSLRDWTIALARSFSDESTDTCMLHGHQGEYRRVTLRIIKVENALEHTFFTGHGVTYQI